MIRHAALSRLRHDVIMHNAAAKGAKHYPEVANALWGLSCFWTGFSIPLGDPIMLGFNVLTGFLSCAVLWKPPPPEVAAFRLLHNLQHNETLPETLSIEDVERHPTLARIWATYAPPEV